MKRKKVLITTRSIQMFRYIVLYFLLIISICLFPNHVTTALPCMTPDDARLITPSFQIPPSWLKGKWHTGKYLSAGRWDDVHEATAEETNRKGVIFTTNGTELFWLKNVNTGGYYMVTKDRFKMLCVHTVGGLRVDWFRFTEANRFEDWCQWEINTKPDDVTMFQMKNRAFTWRMPEIGFVYFDETGLYFDYDDNMSNDARNEVDDVRKWFVWVKAREEQRPMMEMEEQCQMGFSGWPRFMEETENEVTVRSGARRRASGLRSSNKLVTCSSGWFLFGVQCYKAVASIAFTQSNMKNVCRYLRAELVVPRSVAEQRFLYRLLRRVGPEGRYWIGVERGRTGTRFYDLDGEPLTFRRWSKRARSLFHSDRCVYWFRRRWFPANCDSEQNLLCVREAVVRQKVTCGKIQSQSVDALMRHASKPLNPITARIVNGQSAEEGQFPWQAAIRFKSPLVLAGTEVRHNCGGTLIDECWVLTAAHCVPDRDAGMFIVRLGDLNNEIADATEQEFEVERIIIHEEYNIFPSPRFDIALIRLKLKNGKCARFNEFVQPACLPDPSRPTAVGERCQVSGWGVTNYTIGQNSSAPNLQWTTLPRLEDSYCQAKYNQRSELFLENVMICAGLKTGGRDACTGDSGGPYVCRKKGKYHVYGIVSFGIGCAQSLYPGVYTNVAHFIPWIGEKIRANGGGNLVT